METLTLSIGGMTCGHCVKSVRSALEAVPGADVRSVSIGSAEVVLDASTSTEAVLAAVQDAGYDASVAASSPSGSTPRQTAGCGCGCGASADLTPLSARSTT